MRLHLARASLSAVQLVEKALSVLQNGCNDSDLNRIFTMVITTVLQISKASCLHKVKTHVKL